DSSSSGVQAIGTLAATGSDTNHTLYVDSDYFQPFLQTDTNGYVSFYIVKVEDAESLNTSFASKEHTTLHPPRLYTIRTVASSDAPLKVYTDSSDPVNQPGTLLWLREDGLTVDYERTPIYNVAGAIADVF